MRQLRNIHATQPMIQSPGPPRYLAGEIVQAQSFIKPRDHLGLLGTTWKSATIVHTCSITMSPHELLLGGG